MSKLRKFLKKYNSLIKYNLFIINENKKSTLKSDGCTCVPDFDIVDCCHKHDADYHTGGSLSDKIRADLEFYKCIKQKRPVIAIIYTIGVLIFGNIFWNWK